MGKINQNFTMWKGNDVELHFFIEDVPGLSGATIKWAMASDVNSTKLIEKTTASGITIDDATAKVLIDSSDTTGLTPGNYYHELRVVDSVGNIATAAIGMVELKETLIDS